MTRKTKPLPDWDDGRVICPMDAEGMPWRREGSFFGRPHAEPEQEEIPPRDRMTARQTRMYTAGALRAALLMISVFAAALVLFTLFCTKVWFA